MHSATGGRVYLSDMLHTLAASPAAKPHPDGAGAARGVPVLVELVTADGEVIGFGPVTGWELVTSTRDHPGVLVLRAEVKRFPTATAPAVITVDPPADLAPVAVESTGAVVRADAASHPPAFDGTTWDGVSARRVNLKREGPTSGQ